MKKMMMAFGAAATAAAVMATSVAPASAAPMAYHTHVNVMSAAYMHHHNNNKHHHNKFERRGNLYFFNGYRGYTERHPGYRFYNGFWFPPLAFGFYFGGNAGHFGWW